MILAKIKATKNKTGIKIILFLIISKTLGIYSLSSIPLIFKFLRELCLKFACYRLSKSGFAVAINFKIINSLNSRFL